MNPLKDSTAFWATILGTLVGLFGVIQNFTWVMLGEFLLATGSLGALLYAQRQRLRLRSVDLVINGHSIDSLGMAGLRRRINRTLVIQEVRNVAVIDGEDLTVTWRCAGYCRADRETMIEFSIDADRHVPFDQLECAAYDLRRDPGRHHCIKPFLVGPDGIAKKIAVPFLEPLAAEEPFAVLLTCHLPGCMTRGIDYYTATLSFAQDRVGRYSSRLSFAHDRPAWVRVYEQRPGCEARLLNDLRPVHEDAGTSEYLDVAADVPASSARIYVFMRKADEGCAG